MLAFLRRLRSVVALLVLSLCVGPAAAALCPHADAVPVTPDTSHEQAPSAMPCHTVAPEQDQMATAPHERLSAASPSVMDCDSPCCAAQAQIPAPTVPRIEAPATTILCPAQILTVAQADIDVHLTTVPERPPPPAARLHLLLGCFLT